MNRPKVSVGAIMAVLFVVAIDCVIVRSFSERPDATWVGDVELILFSSLPMANLLAIGVAALVGSRAQRTPSRWGFAAGAGLGVLATILGVVAVFEMVDDVRPSVASAQWADDTTIIDRFVASFVLAGVPLVFQAVVGLIGAWVGRVIGARRRSEPVEIRRAGRPRLASLLTLVILAGLPAVMVEGYFRLDVDPRIERFAPGEEAVIDLTTEVALPQLIPAASPIHQLASRKVRVDSDTEPFDDEPIARSPEGIFCRDHREVRVTILDGPKAGELTTLPYYLLRSLH